MPRFPILLLLPLSLCLAEVPTAWSPDTGEELSATVLLVTSAELAEAWQPFAEWKTRCGKPTSIVTVEAIAAASEEGDVQTRMRAYIRQAIAERGTRWVILGGDSGPDGSPVPDRDTRHRLGRSLRYDDIPSDVWFIGEGDWDANGDGIYGDWRNDRPALSYVNERGACIGRIPVRSVEDVAAYTDKAIAYESAYPEDAFAESFTYTCAVPQANYKADMLWDRNLAEVWSGSIARYFTDVTPWDRERRGDHALSPANWVAHINEKSAGKMHMHGHGLLDLWVLERHRPANAASVARLENEDAYLVMTTVSCFTGQFDGPKDPSITESMLRAPKAGAVVAVAPAREGVPVFLGGGGDPRDGRTQDGTTRFLTRFWCHGVEADLTTGEAFAAAQAELAEDAAVEVGYHWVLSEINLLGDPTLPMRAGRPVTPAVSAPARLTQDAELLEVEVGAAGLTVCVWQRGGLYATATSAEDGAVAFALTGLEAGALELTVSGPGANAVTRTIAVE